ncbi:hypothetical protein [Hydrogenophaga sp.]|uniref:hypothetical protein n=1 Tax=Hydrogenophaga sp. TaxID=1904254 RepID=UPI0025C4FFB4|nr:hypothetical protein [Hydrogenophaga sp.]
MTRALAQTLRDDTQPNDRSAGASVPADLRLSVADLVSLTRDPSGLKPLRLMAMLAVAGASGVA